MATTSAKASRAARTGPSGSTPRQRLGLGGAVDDVGAGLRPWPDGPEQGQRLGVQGVIGQRAAEQLEQAGVVGRGRGLRHQHRQRGDALAEVGAGGLAGLGRVGGDVDDVVGELEGGADDLAVRRERLLDLGAGAAEAGAVAGRGGDEGTGLAGDDLEVVLERVLVGAGLDRLQDLALDQPGEGLGLDPDGVRAQQGGELGGLREQEVAGQDRDQVVPAGVGRLRAAAQVGLVHDVVVVERADVGDLDDAGRGDDVVDVRVLTGLGGQQHQQRPEPLAAGVEQVRGGLGDEREPALDVPVERLLDLLHAAAQPRLEVGVGDGQRRGRPSVELT